MCHGKTIKLRLNKITDYHSTVMLNIVSKVLLKKYKNRLNISSMEKSLNRKSALK